ncbi:hypothetical protein G5I_06594 [Acromyrmex echinatior]|uniref:Uncharacterized protein n=1 Tax=Acromyrmex echinatior TaxID=103372 RepID=F4WLG7_ACREC|nr:hypothetical protein G5I_06594 [Acromyrmex echinatior]
MLVAEDIYDVDRSSHRGLGYKLADHGGNSRNLRNARGSYAGGPSEAEIELFLMYPSWMGYKRCRWRIHDRGRPSSRDEIYGRQADINLTRIQRPMGNDLKDK